LKLPEDLTSVCLLRLSALGDVVNTVPLLRSLQAALPRARLTWIIGRAEHKLLGDIEGVEFIVFDKKAGRPALSELQQALAGRRFDALLVLQRSLRANLLSLRIPARLRVGYDWQRSAELHSLFVNRRIRYRPRQHSLDLMHSFVEPLGIAPGPVRWDIPVPDEARDWAATQLPDGAPVMLFSPCSSQVLRNWHARGYAALADHAALRHGYRIVLCGGRSTLERKMADDILSAMQAPALDLVGKDTFKRFLALLQRATVVVTPDSGPMHMARAMGAPVIGLHAATPAWGSGPWGDTRWCVDRYEQAALKYAGKPADRLKWGRRLQFPGVMDLVTIEDAIAAFERFVAFNRSCAAPSPPR
jgi:heptosyltransferase I